MALHGGLMFLAIRKHIYGMPMTSDLETLIDLQIRVYLPGARPELQRLHGEQADRALTVWQLVRPSPQRRSR